MKSLTPITVFFMMMSIIFLITNRAWAVYFALSTLVVLFIQLVVIKQHKHEPAIIFNVIVAIIIILFSLVIRK